MRRPWPARLAVREGLANARSWPRLATTVTAAIALMTCAAGLANAIDVNALVAAERAWIEGGAFVLVVEPAPERAGADGSGARDDGAGLDVAACDRLSQVDGIDASFAATVTERTARPANAPGTRATLTLASPGVYDFLAVPVPDSPAMLVTPRPAADTGVVDGERTTFTLSTWAAEPDTVVERTVRLVDDQVLGEQLTGSYLAPGALTGTAQQCYVRAEAGSLDDVAAYLGAALRSPDGTSAIVRPRLSENAHGMSFATAYDTRVLRWAWLVGAAVLVALWAVVQRTRRSRWAIYATFGATTRARMLIAGTEWLSLSAAGSVWGWGIAMAFALGLGVDVHVALPQVTGHVVATWGAAALGGVLAGLAPVGTLLDSLKDRT